MDLLTSDHILDLLASCVTLDLMIIHNNSAK